MFVVVLADSRRAVAGVVFHAENIAVELEDAVSTEDDIDEVILLPIHWDRIRDDAAIQRLRELIMDTTGGSGYD